ncbi:MAG: PAS domain S-box protein [Melioribacter sp.]|uniref:PAS domain S-box protein n=1 Tax=Rosettibacter primus TaxID=3111523 RepID=UPI00247E972B|nr:PAS domain S-box protein [Melioribacter sp.]
MVTVQIIYNLSVLVAASVISNFLDVRWNRNTLTGKILQGITFGFISILAMLNPFVLSKGIIFDGRSVVLSLCALFFGNLSGIIAGFMAIVTRIYIGGGGVLMGVSVITTSIIVGLVFHLLRRKNKIQLSNLNLYLFGIVVHTLMIILMILLPKGYTSQALQTVGLTVIIFYPIATVLIGKILLDHEINLKINKELKESESVNRAILEAIPDIVFLIDKNGNFLAYKTYSTDELYVPPEEFLGKNIKEVLPPFLADITMANIQKALSKKEMQVYEYDLQMPDGIQFYEARMSPGIYDNVVVVIRNITNQKLFQEKLLKSEKKFSTLFQKTSVPVELLKFPELQYADVNLAWTDLFGFSKEEIIGKDAIEIGIIKSKETISFLVNEIKLNNHIKNYEQTLITKTGNQIIVLSNSDVIEIDGAEYLLTSLQDITLLKKSEEEIKKLNRIYAVLSDINQMIVRKKNKQKIFDEACRIAVEIGLFKLAWIGEINQTNMKIIPVSIYDESKEYFRQLEAAFEQEQFIQSQLAETIGSKKYKIINDVELLPMEKIAKKYNLKSAAFFPIIVADKVVAILCFYSDEKDFFDNVEIKLLNELATDISYALSAIDNDLKRQEAENKVKENERFLSTLIDNLPGFIYRCANDKDWTMFYISRQCEEITGYKQEEFINNNVIAFNDIIHPAYQQLLWNEWQKILSQRKYFEYEYPIITKTGELKWVWERGRGIFSEQGELQYLEGFITDITKRKLLETMIKEEEEKLRLLVEGTSYFFFYTHDTEGRITYISPSVEQITGYKVEEWLNQTHWFVTDSPINLQARENTRKMLRGEKCQYPVYLEINNSKNEKILLEVYEVPYYKDGKIVGLHGIARDVTEQKRAEELLKKSYDRLNRAEIVSKSGNWELNLNTKKISASKGAALIYGMDVEEVNYEDIKKVPLPEYRTLLDNALKNLIENDIPYDVEFKIKKVDTGEIRDIHSVAFYDKSSRIIFGIIQDITEKKKLIEELIEAKEKAVTSEKIKTNFLAQMSHEIRTPINIIMGNLSLLKEELCKNLDDEICELFDGIELANKRIMRTIDLILNVSELQTKSYEPIFKEVDLGKNILPSLYEEHKLLAEKKNLKFILNNKIKDARIIADEYSITQIFANLIDNALKYTQAGDVEINLDKNEKGEIFVEVKDTGIGMSEEFMQHIFEPFNQEEQGYSRSYDGTGLGLSLVKSYCEINKAKIEVESKKGEGTTFRVTFCKD